MDNLKLRRTYCPQNLCQHGALQEDCFYVHTLPHSFITQDQFSGALLFPSGADLFVSLAPCSPKPQAVVHTALVEQALASAALFTL